MARPSDYSIELAAKICGELAEGQSLKSICAAEDMPAKSTVYLWLTQHQAFLDMYAHAREDQADTLADEIVEIADDATRDTKVDEDGNETCDHEWLGRSRLRVDARKWVAAKLKPKKYGDRIDHNVSVTPITVNIGLDPDEPKARATE